MFYLAAPFFTIEQTTILDAIEHVCDTYAIPVFSPRRECLCPPDASEEQRRASFQANVQHIHDAEFVLARIDDFDPGTVWEMGYAFGQKVPVYAFTTVPGRGLNLMLAQASAGFLSGMLSVGKFLEGSKHGDFSEAKPWTKPIV